MKILTTTILVLMIAFLSGCSSKIQPQVEENVSNGMTLEFADKKWDGVTIPKDEVCSNYNTKAGWTPAIKVTKLPPQTNILALTYSDDTFKPMSMGGHGMVSYKVKEGTTSLIIPSMPGETFDLPQGFKSEIPHKGVKFGKKEGAYLAPCSGGKGNIYALRVEAIHVYENDKPLPELLDTKDLVLGRY